MKKIVAIFVAMAIGLVFVSMVSAQLKLETFKKPGVKQKAKTVQIKPVRPPRYHYVAYVRLSALCPPDVSQSTYENRTVCFVLAEKGVNDIDIYHPSCHAGDLLMKLEAPDTNVHTGFISYDVSTYPPVPVKLTALQKTEGLDLSWYEERNYKAHKIVRMAICGH